MTKKGRLILLLSLVGGICVLAVLAIVVALSLLRPVLRERLVEEALKRGYRLGFDDVELSIGSLSIENARFGLVGVRSLGGRAKRIDVTLSSLTLSSLTLAGIAIEELELDLLGSLPVVALEITEWTKEYPGSYALPLGARPVSVTWLAAPNTPPVLVVRDAEVSRSDAGGAFRANAAKVAGVDVSGVAASFRKGQGRVTLGFGSATPGTSQVVIDVKHEGDAPSARLELKPTDVEQLALTFGVPAPLEGVSVSAKAELILPPRVETAPVKGTLHVALDGYVPPHPTELDGILFGKTTTFDTDFSLSADHKVATFSNTRVKAGAFALDGDGDVHRYENNARVRLRLSGNLPCSELARATTQNAIRGSLGALAGKLAQKAVGGGVGVRLNIDADTRALDAAKVQKIIGVGCGLKPVRLPTQKEIEEFAKELPRFMGELPKLSLPKGLPSALPALPPLPKFDIRLPTPKGSSDG